MKDIVLISIPETTIKSLVESAVKKALAEHESTKTGSLKSRALTFEEGCAYVNISKSHGYKLTSKGLIPHSKRGKRIYFDQAELDEWLLANRVSTVDELQAETDQYLSRKQSRN